MGKNIFDQLAQLQLMDPSAQAAHSNPTPNGIDWSKFMVPPGGYGPATQAQQRMPAEVAPPSPDDSGGPSGVGPVADGDLYSTLLGASSSSQSEPPKAPPQGAGPVTPEQQLMAQISKLQASGIGQQQEGIDKTQALVDKAQGHKAELDLSPLASLVDSWTGSNFRQGYKVPKSKEDLDKEAIGLQEILQKQKQGLSEDQIKLLHQQLLEKMYGAKAGASGGKAIESQWQKLTDEIDPNKARTGEFGRQAQLVNKANQALVIRDQNPTLNFTKNQTREFATAIANLVGSNGSTAVHSVNELVPSSGTGTYNDILSAIENKPRGREQQEFIKLLVETAERERNLAASNVKSIQFSRLPNFEHLSKADSQRFGDIIKAKTHSNSALDDYAAFKQNGFQLKSGATGGGVVSADDQAALQYIKDNPGTEKSEQLISILRQKGAM